MIVVLTQSIVTLIYCAFLADWGEREHIFMPVSCLFGHLALADHQHGFSYADGHPSMVNLFSPYHPKKLLSFEDPLGLRREVHRRRRWTRAHEYLE